ncbi:hypothetical protein COLO4_37883 [Corchorus olitorius]|uniref:Uncharacterized protein n=1 Tax=Corchorus olitorius TaxID=93759 RepID=A0A1R3FYD1_9ROSI|nr:hypothetical protein COLO4_37883 [Corchorus olitorius]
MQKIVLKLIYFDEKQLKKVKKKIIAVPEVQSVEKGMEERIMDMKQIKLTVISIVDIIHPLLNKITNQCLVDKLRNKRGCSVEVVSVEPYKDKEEEEEEEEKKKAQKKDDEKKEHSGVKGNKKSDHHQKEEGKNEKQRRDEHTAVNAADINGYDPYHRHQMAPYPYDPRMNTHHPSQQPPYPHKVVTEDQYPSPSCVIC